MSMNEKAIQEIIKNANTEKVMDKVSGSGTNSNLLAIPRDFDIVDLEKYMTNRDQFRANMKTNSIDEFARYNEEYASKEKSQCFINQESMVARSIFDIGTTEKAGHGYHKANLGLKKTALYIDLLDFNDSPQGQREAAEWIEDHAEFLQAFDVEGNVMDIPSVSMAIRNLTVSRESGRTSTEDDFAASQSEFDRVAIKTKEGVAMPAVLKYMCEPYNGLDVRGFELRHSIIERNKTAYVNFRIKMLEKHQEDMAVEFKEKLDAKLSDVIPVYLGTIEL